MPTALTTATARQDLVEAAVHVAGLVKSNGVIGKSDMSAPVSRISVLTARYLNTLRLDPESGEAQHEELDTETKALLDRAVELGALNLMDRAHQDNSIPACCRELRQAASDYLRVQMRKHSL